MLNDLDFHFVLENTASAIPSVANQYSRAAVQFFYEIWLILTKHIIGNSSGGPLIFQGSAAPIPFGLASSNSWSVSSCFMFSIWAHNLWNHKPHICFPLVMKDKLHSIYVSKGTKSDDGLPECWDDSYDIPKLKYYIYGNVWPLNRIDNIIKNQQLWTELSEKVRFGLRRRQCIDYFTVI